MSNPEGTPIWYELLTNDPDASKAFYDEVFGWNVQPPSPDRDYRLIDTGNGMVGGVLKLTAEMQAGGAKPSWLFYVGVDDVDATAEKVVAAGGAVTKKPFDIPNVGRLAMVDDPQGIPLYVMRGASPEDSTAFDRMGMGKCNWNELSTPDQAAANEFYAKVFGWTYPDKMEMPGAGDYVFIAVGDNRIGATMTEAEGTPRGWQFYFRAPDIDAAVEKIKRGGGKVHAGPMEVPGGDRVVVASDPHGVLFGVAAPGK
jgi:uncharacterized protein